jgi:hypothetical protein
MKKNKLLNRNQIAILGFLLIFGLTSYAYATTYYVSPTGDDRNSGSNPSTPWEHCPGMNGYSGTGSLKSGDIVYFDNAGTWTSAGGDYYLQTTAGVTYDGATYGSGTRAKLVAGYTHASVVLIKVSNVTFTGFEIDVNDKDTCGITLNWPESSSNISTITISNCSVHNTNATDVHKYGILVGSTNGHTTSNVNILNNTIYNTGHEGLALYTSYEAGDAASNILVRGNEIYNAGRVNPSLTCGQGILVKNTITNATIEYNYVHDNALIGIQNETVSGYSGPTNIIVRYNIFKNNKIWGLYVLGDGVQVDWKVYGNLFVSNGNTSGSEGGQVFFTGQNHNAASTWKFYNNVFYSVGVLRTNKYNFIINGSTNPIVELKNNIFYSDNHLCFRKNTGGTLTHNNNLFWRTDGNNSVVTDGSSYVRDSVTNWEPSAQKADPAFKNTSDLPTGFSGTYGTSKVPNADGLSIQSTSPARDNGIGIPGTVYNGAINFSGTNLGKIRPQGAAWDIGAYEYDAEPKPPFPPSNLRIVP